MAYNTTASWEKFTRTDYVDFGKCQARFGQLCWSKNDSKYLVVKLKVFKKDDNRDFRLVINIKMAETDFNQLVRLRNPCSRKLGRDQKLSPIHITTMSKDMEEQFMLAHNLVDVVHHPDMKICDFTAIHCGQPREFPCSNLKIYKKEVRGIVVYAK